MTSHCTASEKPAKAVPQNKAATPTVKDMDEKVDISGCFGRDFCAAAMPQRQWCELVSRRRRDLDVDCRVFSVQHQACSDSKMRRRLLRSAGDGLTDRCQKLLVAFR